VDEACRLSVARAACRSCHSTTCFAVGRSCDAAGPCPWQTAPHKRQGSGDMSAELFEGNGLSARHVRSAFGWIALAGMALRLLWAWWVPIDPVSDSFVYDRLAMRLAEGLGYTWEDGAPAAFWPVGTSALYAGIYSEFGHSYTAVIASHLVLYLAILAG